jgi:predicted DNA-binding transcriptional regulator AlpA
MPRGIGNLKIAVSLWDVLTCGVSSPSIFHRLKQTPDICFLGDQGKQGPTVAERVGGASTPAQAMTRPGEDPTATHPTEGESRWTSGCAGRFGSLGRPTGTAPWLKGTVMPGADEVRGRRERDKLTIAEVCADLDISRRTFYEWRAKGRAPRCITLPNGSLRVRRSEYHRWLASREEAA